MLSIPWTLISLTEKLLASLDCLFSFSFGEGLVAHIIESTLIDKVKNFDVELICELRLDHVEQLCIFHLCLELE